MTFNAKDYELRELLDRAVVAEIGTDEAKNRDALHEIQGTKEELKKLQLSDESRVYGVKVVVTDSQNKTINLVKKKK